MCVGRPGAAVIHLVYTVLWTLSLDLNEAGRAGRFIARISDRSYCEDMKPWMTLLVPYQSLVRHHSFLTSIEFLDAARFTPRLMSHEMSEWNFELCCSAND